MCMDQFPNELSKFGVNPQLDKPFVVIIKEFILRCLRLTD